MRSFSDAQTLSDRTEEQERYSYGQARPGAVGVRGEGDLWGRGGYRHLLARAGLHPLQNDMP